MRKSEELERRIINIKANTEAILGQSVGIYMEEIGEIVIIAANRDAAKRAASLLTKGEIEADINAMESVAIIPEQATNEG